MTAHRGHAVLFRTSASNPIPYYGAADTSVALATGSIRELLLWVKPHAIS